MAAACGVCGRETATVHCYGCEADLLHVRLAHLQHQTDQLATFILEGVPGEPSQGRGAVETAMRIITALQKEVATLRAELLAFVGPDERVGNIMQEIAVLRAEVERLSSHRLFRVEADGSAHLIRCEACAPFMAVARAADWATYRQDHDRAFHGSSSFHDHAIEEPGDCGMCSLKRDEALVEALAHPLVQAVLKKEPA